MKSQAVGSLSDVEAIERDSQGPQDKSTYDLLRRAAETYGEAPALSFFLRADQYQDAETWTYQELFAGITATANFLSSLGISNRDVVGIVLPNLPETHLAIWGSQAAGIAFPLNSLLEPSAIAQLLTSASVKALITLSPTSDPDLWKRIQPAINRAESLQHVIFVDLADHKKGLRSWSGRYIGREAVGMDNTATASLADIRHDIQVHDFATSVGRQDSGTLTSGRAIAPEERSSFFCTGGTTGLPKIAMRTHRNEVFNAWSSARFHAALEGKRRTIFCGLPLFHVNAVQVTGTVPFSQGGHVVIGTTQGFRGEGVIAKFWDIVEHYRINSFSGVPTLYASLLQVPVGNRDISSLEFGVCGSAPMPKTLIGRVEEVIGLKILEGYGLTEGTCVCTCNPLEGERRAGSIGFRMPLQQIRVIKTDDSGKYAGDCDIGEIGVLTIKGPNVFAGYLVSEHNDGIWLDLGDGERWLNTGDLGRQDKDGYFYLTGRKKDLIIRGGHNIDPASIEEPLNKHPSVQLAAAVGRPDAHAGEVPVAYVQLKPGHSASSDELLDFAKDAIGERAAVPKWIQIVEQMPVTAVGKIFKPALRRREISEAVRTALHEAGVQEPLVTVIDDPRNGTVVDVTVRGMSAAKARELLEKFSFSVRVSEST